jgi:hypothetical protein
MPRRVTTAEAGATTRMQERDGLRSRAGGRSRLIDVVGDVRINAGDRTATVVEVPPKPPEPDRAGHPAGSPHDPSSEEDLQACWCSTR